MASASARAAHTHLYGDVRIFVDDFVRTAPPAASPGSRTSTRTRFARDLVSFGFTAVERLTPAVAAERYYGGQPVGVTPFEVWQVIAAQI